MEDLAVRCYEDGGAQTLGGVERKEMEIKDNYLQITFTAKPKTFSVILKIL